MAKYIIDVPDGTKWIEAYYAVDHFRYQGKSILVDSLIPYTEPDRKDIEDEVWELASKLIWTFPERECRQIFGMESVYVPRDMTYQEAKSKYEAWLKQKEDEQSREKIIQCRMRYCPFI